MQAGEWVQTQIYEDKAHPGQEEEEEEEELEELIDKKGGKKQWSHS